MARRYQKMQGMLPEIKQMLKEGKSQREVAEILGLEGDRPVHDLLKREGKRKYREYASRENANQQKRWKSTSERTSV